jgi:hypothetical protein
MYGKEICSVDFYCVGTSYVKTSNTLRSSYPVFSATSLAFSGRGWRPYLVNDDVSTLYGVVRRVLIITIPCIHA